MSKVLILLFKYENILFYIQQGEFAYYNFLLVITKYLRCEQRGRLFINIQLFLPAPDAKDVTGLLSEALLRVLARMTNTSLLLPFWLEVYTRASNLVPGFKFLTRKMGSCDVTLRMI